MNLNEIRDKLKVLKSNYNSFGKYHYRRCEDILDAVKPLLGTSTLIISDEMAFLGNRMYVMATATLTQEDGKQFIVKGFARESENKKGMDEAQITGSASSYARKRALEGLFLIDDVQDSDATNESGDEISAIVELKKIIVQKINTGKFSEEKKNYFRGIFKTIATLSDAESLLAEVSNGTEN